MDTSVGRAVHRKVSNGGRSRSVHCMLNLSHINHAGFEQNDVEGKRGTRAPFHEFNHEGSYRHYQKELLH